MDRFDPDLKYNLKLSSKVKNKSEDFKSFITHFFPVTFHSYREGADLAVLEKLKGLERDIAVEILKRNLHLKDKNIYIAKAATFFGLS